MTTDHRGYGYYQQAEIVARQLGGGRMNFGTHLAGIIYALLAIADAVREAKGDETGELQGGQGGC